MSIRLNLLAEAQALEELRRRDPVKRLVWVAGFIVFLVLLFSGWLQWKVIRANGRLNRIETELSAQGNQFKQITDNQKQLLELEQKLNALNQMATNRFLWANVLNALQLTTVSDVQLLRLRSEQGYHLNEEVKSRVNEAGKTIPGRAAFVTENMTLMLDAKDISPNPGSQIDRYKAALMEFPYFIEVLGPTNSIQLKTVSPPQIDPETGRSQRQFLLECRFPEKVYK